MALKPCRECKKDVSTSAKRCPHCGVAAPARTGASGGIVLLCLLCGVGLLVWLVGSRGTTPAPSGTAASPQDAAVADDVNARCRADWHHCGDNAQIANFWSGWSHVKSQCKEAANTAAKYGAPKWPWFAFGSFYTGTSYLTGNATVIEPDAQFQNTFGANEHVHVICSYDLNLDTVTDVSVTPRS